VDEGIELLTGVPAGTRQPDGSYQEGTVHHLVDNKLREMAEKLSAFGGAGRGRPRGNRRLQRAGDRPADPPDEE